MPTFRLFNLKSDPRSRSIIDLFSQYEYGKNLIVPRDCNFRVPAEGRAQHVAVTRDVRQLGQESV